MQVVEIIIGIVLLVVAAACVFWALEEATVVPIGVTIITALLGSWLIYHGVHGEHVKFHDKHAAILSDLHQQGFDVPYNRVYAVGGHQLYGTEVDLAEGACLFPFNTTKIAGVWHVTLVRPDGNGVTVLTPAETDRLAASCGG